MHLSRLHFAALIVVIALGCALRLAYLDAPMRYDEAATAQFFVVKPLRESLADYSVPNNHLFHTLLAHLSYRAFGVQPPAIRLPAFIAGVLLLPAVYLAGQALYGRDAALIATALCAASAPLILYAVNARGYSLIGLAFLALLGVAAGLRQGRTVGFAGRTRLASSLRWGAFVVIGALGMWTIPVMLYPLAVVGAWLLLSFALERRSGALGVLLLAGALTVGLTLLLYLPVLEKWGIENVIDNDFVRARAWDEFIADLPGFIGRVWGMWLESIPAALAWLLLALALLGVMISAKCHLPLLPLALAVLLALVLLQRTTGYPRVWLFLLPLFYLHVGVGAVWLIERIAARRQGRGDAESTQARDNAERTPQVGDHSERTTQASSLQGALLAIVIAVGLGVVVWTSGAVAQSYDTGAFHAVEPVAERLRAELQPADRVATDGISGRILRYYEIALDFQWRSIAADEPAPPRIFVVVNHQYSTLAERLLALGERLDLSLYGEPVLLLEDADGALYRLDLAPR